MAEGDEREQLWSAQKRDVPAFAEYEAKTSRRIPVIILEPAEDTATLRRYRQLGRRWLFSPTLGTSPPDELTRRRLQESLAAMAEARQSPSSIHQAAVLLSGCLAWAQRQGHLGANPALGLRLPDGTRLAPPRRR